MSDLKEFWDGRDDVINGQELKFSLGLFFWGRGGKQFVKLVKDREERNYQTRKELFKRPKQKRTKIYFDDVLWQANNQFQPDILTEATITEHTMFTRDFLDCLACLGEERVKELIKKFEGKGE